MPIQNTVKRTKGEIPYTIIPNFIFEAGNSDAIAIYCYLLSKPDEWVIRKRDIMKTFSIGEQRYRNAREVLRELGLWKNEAMRGKSGKMLGQIIWITTEIPENRTSVKPTRRSNRPDGQTAPLVSKESLVSKDCIQSKDKHMKPSGFDRFWAAYPKKKNKQQAIKAFKTQKINGELQTVIDDIESMKNTNDWLCEGGQFIPYPSSYLNGRRWEDETNYHGEPF